MQLMIIGIDGNEANVEKQVGVSVYANALLHYFQEHADTTTRFVIFLRDRPLSHMPKETEHFTYEIVPARFLWSQLALPLQLFIKKNINVFFSPAHYAPRFCPVPSVVTIHDLSYMYFPNEFLKKDLHKLNHWTKYSVNKASKIIAVSNNTKEDVVKLYDIPKNKIKVIYNGYEKQKRGSTYEVGRSRSSVGERGNPYILYVGTLQPRKNVTALIGAFFAFKKKHPDFKLKLVGKKGWLYDDIFAAVKRLDLEHAVDFEGYASTEKLQKLYANAFCFVLPSLYEGFGIPILEAMSFGCPVIASNVSSLPEIGGDACLYFDPYDKKDLLDKLNLICDDESVRKTLIQKGNERVKHFSWEKCAKQTLQLLISVGSNVH